MPVQEEIEVKFWLDNPQRARDAIRRIGGTFEGAHSEDNIRLDDSSASLKARGLVLRVRHIRQEGKEPRYLLTVKQNVTGSDADLSRRKEFETEVADGPALLAALATLGYGQSWRYEKRRETYRLESVIADIDELPFGWFLELEGPADAIRDTAAKLGFKMRDGLMISYAQLFDRVKRAYGLTMQDLTFEAFEGHEVDAKVFRAGDTNTG